MTQYKLVVDCATGKQEYVALTPAEIAERDQQAAAAAEEQAKRDAEAAAKAAAKESAGSKLSSLGLTEAEIKALGF
jgi:nucleoid-associated protein YgaU